MTSEQRRKFIRWFCILAPTLGVLFVLGILVLNAAGPSRLSQPFSVPARFQNFLVVSPMIGWIVLTIACSITLALDLLRNRGHHGARLAVYVVLLSPLIAVSHCCVAAAVGFTGCVAMANGGFIH